MVFTLRCVLPVCANDSSERFMITSLPLKPDGLESEFHLTIYTRSAVHASSTNAPCEKTGLYRL